jgi:hypothetical protein
LIPQPIRRWLAPGPFRNSSETCARLSRLLLLLVAVELVTMPLTQHLWTWDGFLHGGEDFELGLFMAVVCICLVLLRAQHGRQLLPLLFVACHRLLQSLGGWQRPDLIRASEVTGIAGRLSIPRSSILLTFPLLI